MKTILDNSVIELEVKKSKFIGYSFKVEDVKMAERHLKEIKKEHANATHVCFAYVVNGQEKCSDDGEPSGTAGLPILDVIKKNGLNNVLILVVRYFGGVKLGAGGLVRAYSNCCSAVIKSSAISTLVEYNIYKLEVNYQNMPTLNSIIKKHDMKILNTTYANNILIELATTCDISLFSNVAKNAEFLGKSLM